MRYLERFTIVGLMAAFLMIASMEQAFAQDAGSPSDVAYEADDLPDVDADEEEDGPNWHGGLMITLNAGPQAGAFFYSSDNYVEVGATAALQLGYHWRYFGIFLEQRFFANWQVASAPSDDLTAMQVKENEDVMEGAWGESNLLIKFYIPIFNLVVIDIGLGAGLLYTQYHEYSDSETDKWERIPVGRAQVGVTWLLGEHFMLGVRVDLSATYTELTGIDYTYINASPSLTLGWNI